VTRAPVLLAALSGLVAVATGAFGAHGAEGEAREWLRTGGEYQLAHAVAALAALGVRAGGGGRQAAVAAWLFLGGGAVFSGTLYAMAFGASRGLGVVTPVGGVLLLAGWAALMLAALRLPPALPGGAKKP